MGELTRWQPMVSLYTYFTDCPRKEGGPSTGSVSQYESARGCIKFAFQGQKEDPAAVVCRFPAPSLTTSSAELGTVPGVFCCLLFPPTAKHNLAPPHQAHCSSHHMHHHPDIASSTYNHTHTNSVSKECEICKIQEYNHES